MSYNVIPTDNFNKEVKQLAKKYHSLKDDLIKLRAELLENPMLGTSLGSNIYKIRMAITSKGKGKSSGARVISFVYVLNKQIYLIDIYDKSERDNISDKDIKAYIKNLPI